MKKTFLFIWIYTSVVVVYSESRHPCCQPGIDEGRSSNPNCINKFGPNSNCGLMFKACCEKAMKTRYCRIGITFGRAEMLCTLDHAISIQCCESCKEGTGSKKNCNEHNGNVYAKRAFKQCCLSGKRKKNKENVKTKVEEKDKKKKEVKEKCSCASTSSTGCKQTDKGPQCICKEGFELKTDGSCQDGYKEFRAPCCQKGIDEGRSSNPNCILKFGPNSSCGLMFKACCENAVKTRQCRIGITFGRADMLCTLDHAIAIQCCETCKEGTGNKKNCTGLNGNVYAKHAFKQCCLSGKTNKHKENVETKEEEKDKTKKEVKENVKTKEEEKDKKKKEVKEKCSCASKSSTGCKQTDKGPQCICKEGFELKTEGSCQDINECEVKGKNFCNRKHWCWNEVGYYRCVYTCTSPKYRQHVINNRYVCKDVNECAEGSDNCNEETHTCINQIGGYKCERFACKKGYKLVGKNCEEIDACKASPCGTGDYCYNAYGKAYCIKQECPNVKYYEQRLASGSSIKECVKKCDRLRGVENEKCWKTEQFPSSIKRYAYKFQKKLEYGRFKFNYWWSFNRNYYNVDIRISDGNEGNVFYIEFTGGNRLNIFNHKPVNGPRNLEFTMRMDVTSRRSGKLVWRYLYKFYFYISS